MQESLQGSGAPWTATTTVGPVLAATGHTQPGVTPRTGGIPQLCHRCLHGEERHAKHVPTAHNCVLYGIPDPSPSKAKQIMLELDIALARDEAMRVRTSTSPSAA